MNENRYRARAERGDVQLGTWATMIRTPSVLAVRPPEGSREWITIRRKER